MEYQCIWLAFASRCYNNATSKMEPEFFVSLGGKTSVSSGIVPTLDSNYWEGVVPASRSKNMKHLKFHVFYETSTEMASENRILLIQKNPGAL